MDWLIAFAIAISLGAGLTAPMGSVLVKTYKDERRRLEGTVNPHILTPSTIAQGTPNVEEIYQPDEPIKKYPTPRR